jgi:hypothetical protein
MPPIPYQAEERTRLDAFKVTILGAVLVSLIALGVIVYVAQDAITNSTAPDEETGYVTSKAQVTDSSSANYSISLSDGKTLYIQNDNVLYDSILVNQTFTFDCRIDFNHRMSLIQSVNPQFGVVASKAPATVNDGSSVKYSVNLVNGKTLYISSNATLYQSLAVNQGYLFNCQVDYTHNWLLINGARAVSP